MNNKNPIIDNRIVNDVTFAVRLKNFISSIEVCDAMSAEEQDYLLRCADKLLNYQISTVIDIYEIDYFKRLSIRSNLKK